ncbi:conserved hypothetical protein [Pseudomonas sp. 8AS]|nr:conserved hypothetical protein [Pseudomonas sp. 8AS]
MELSPVVSRGAGLASESCFQSLLKCVVQALVLDTILSRMGWPGVLSLPCQLRRGLWNTTMDLPSSYSKFRLPNRVLTD